MAIFPLPTALLAGAAVAALVVMARIGARMRPLGPLVTNDAAPRGGVSLQLALDRAAVVDILRSWDHAIPGRGERATDVSLRLLELDGSFIWGYCSAFAFAGLAPMAGFGLSPAWLALASGGWLAAVLAMGRADTIENAAMDELLRAGPDGVQAGRHDGAVGRLWIAARLKWALFFGEFAAIVGLWVVFFLRR